MERKLKTMLLNLFVLSLCPVKLICFLLFSFFRKDELLNSIYSQSEFTLDEGEHLLKGMQELREELNSQSDVLTSLAERAQSVVPLKQRRQPVTRPVPVLAVCNYNQGSVSKAVKSIILNKILVHS